MQNPYNDHGSDNTAEPDAFAVAVAALRDAAAAGKVALAQTLVRMMTPAGAQFEWDSETIEAVLEPAASVLDAAGLPWIGNAEDASHRYWSLVALADGQMQDYFDADGNPQYTAQ
jgi:hypothetical protein